MKNKKLIQSIGVVFIIIIFSIFGTPRYQSIKIKSEGFSDLENKLKEASNANSEIDINKLTNFDWDECYVFGPYYPSKAVYEKVGTEWTTAKTFIGFLMSHSAENETVNDNQFLVVFKKENKVVLAERYSTNEIPVIFKLDNDKFTSNNAKFLVTVAKQYEGDKIKELVLKKESPISEFSNSDNYIPEYNFTDEEIESAMKVAKTYYNKIGISDDIKSIEYNLSSKVYGGAFGSLSQYKNSNSIIFLVITKDDNIPRIIILTRKDKNNGWEVVNEGY